MKIKLLILFGFIAALIGIAIYSQFRSHHLATIDAGGGISVRVFGKLSFDIDDPPNHFYLDYEILRDGRLLCRERLAGTNSALGLLKFELASSAGSQVIGLTERADPDIVVMLFDRQSHERWPGGPTGYTETAGEGFQRAARLLTLLRPASPQPLSLPFNLRGRQTRL